MGEKSRYEQHQEGRRKKSNEKQFTEPNETKSFVFPINNGEKKQSLQTEEELQINSIQLLNFQRQHKIKGNDMLFNHSKKKIQQRLQVYLNNNENKKNELNKLTQEKNE